VSETAQTGSAATVAAGRGLASDNHAGVHPDVLAALAAANEGHAPAYGADRYTAHAQELLRDHLTLSRSRGCGSRERRHPPMSF